MVKPRHPRLARSRTAQTRLLSSPGSRPRTLTRRRLSPQVLQKHVLDRRRWHTRDELYYAIRGLDSSHTYTRRRRQRALGRLTPVQYGLAFAPIKPQPRPDRSQARVT